MLKLNGIACAFGFLLIVGNTFSQQPPAESTQPPVASQPSPPAAESLPTPTKESATTSQPKPSNSVGRRPGSEVVVIMPYTMEAPEHGYSNTVFGRLGGWMTGWSMCDNSRGQCVHETCRTTASVNRPLVPLGHNCQSDSCCATDGASCDACERRRLLPATRPICTGASCSAACSAAGPLLLRRADCDPPVRPSQLRACDNSYRNGPAQPPYCKESSNSQVAP
jgi:hypothetical protein